MSLCLIGLLLILSKTDLMLIGNTKIFYFMIVQPTPETEIENTEQFPPVRQYFQGHENEK